MTSKDRKHSSVNKKIIQQAATCQHFPHKHLHKNSEVSNSECSYDTIQYYLKNQCDVSEYPHKFVTAPQLNLTCLRC